MAAETHTLVIEDCPPSLNAIGSRGSRWAYINTKKDWQGRFEKVLMGSGMRRDATKAEANIVLRFPERRRRDSGNYKWILEKVLGDALVSGGWLPDDTADQFQVLRVTFDPDRGDKRTTVMLEVTR